MIYHLNHSIRCTPLTHLRSCTTTMNQMLVLVRWCISYTTITVDLITASCSTELLLSGYYHYAFHVSEEAWWTNVRLIMFLTNTCTYLQTLNNYLFRCKCNYSVFYGVYTYSGCCVTLCKCFLGLFLGSRKT